MKLTAIQAAESIGATLFGDKSFVIEGVAAPLQATQNFVCFIEEESYLPDFRKSKSLCWIITEALFEILNETEKQNKTFLVVEKPYHSFVKVLNQFHPPVKSSGKVHPGSFIDPEAKVDSTAQIDGGVVVESGAVIGAHVILNAGVWIGKNSSVGENSHLYPGVKIYPDCVVGKRNTLHSGVVIGSDGFGFLPSKTEMIKIPQIGRAILHDDVEIGANSVVDRGTLDDTIIGQGTKIDNLVQIGHNCKLGRNCILCAFVGLSGNTTLGDHVLLAGQAGTKGHLTIGSFTQVGAQSGVSKDIPPHSQVKGYPAQPLKEYLRLQVLIQKLPSLFKRLSELEKTSREV